VRENAWDCATGNGQTAAVLAEHFDKVFATDISEKQLEHAIRLSNIAYSNQPAEGVNFPESQFDLITVSQAIHWFDFARFYEQVNRVAKSGGIIAIWCYSLFKINPAVDEIVDSFYKKTIGSYWDKERTFVDDAYGTIPFPFEEFPSIPFQMKYSWTLEQLEGYISTWSAIQKYIQANGTNPVPALIAELRPRLNVPIVDVVFPIHLRIGRVIK
jgi:ubiquinone/menaquinone biosynthesis C-methylase UbiE